MRVSHQVKRGAMSRRGVRGACVYVHDVHVYIRRSVYMGNQSDAEII